MSNLATDSLTIAKLSSKNANASSPAATGGVTPKKSIEQASHKQTLFQSNAKSTIDGEPQLNKEMSLPSTTHSLAITTNAVTTTLAETPCKWN